MSLERNQSTHNAFLSNMHNFSGSNDATQMKHDATEQLIRGAQALVDGRNRGLTDDQTVDELTRHNRKQQQNILRESIRRSR